MVEYEANKKQITKEAFDFFSNIMAHIEIVRDNQIQKIYFPMLPFCKYISQDLKRKFNEQVNRESTKTKLADLMDNSDMLIKHMK